MKFDRKILAIGTAAACAWLGSNTARAADTHLVTINAVSSSKCIFNDRSTTISVSIDPAATTTLTSSANLLYRCTNGTTPSFSLTSAYSSNLKLSTGTESFAYSYSGAGTGTVGSGMGSAQSKTQVIGVTIPQAPTADLPPGTYTDTITVTVSP